MKKITTSFVFIISSIVLFAQNDPYIMDNNGLGRYGYLELDATTYTDLNRATHGNVKHLDARWWVDDGNGSGYEKIYSTGPADNNWQCSGDNSTNKLTNNYSSGEFGGEWSAGANCYVSVNAEYCSGSTNSGFNERHFQVVDVDNTAFPGITDHLYDAEGDCAPHVLVGSFTIDPGSLSGISLKRLWFKNIGSALEGTDIPNDGFKVFYESVTGSESFESNESQFDIYGNYNSNSTSNNEYGNDNISVSLSGKTRFYVALCNVNYPSAHGKTVELVILNDGISLSPDLNGIQLLRLNETNITNKSISVPITLIDFKAELSSKQDDVKLSWITTNEINNSHFKILRSENTHNWDIISSINANTSSREINHYIYTDKNPINGNSYYKLEQVDLDGRSSFYGPVVVNKENELRFDIYPNPANDILKVFSKFTNSKIEIINNLGKIVITEELNNNNAINISNLNTGLYHIVLRDYSNRFISIKSFIKK